MLEKTKFSFSAVNNTNLLLYQNRQPIIMPVNRILDVFEHKKTNEFINSKSNVKTEEFSLENNIFIHSLDKNNDIKLNKISKFYKFSNLTNVFEILPYSLKPFHLTSFNSIIDGENNYQSIFYDDETEQEKVIKRNFKLIGSKIENINDFELSNYLGYIIGIYLGRGYLERKDKNLKGSVVLLCTKDNFDIIHNILDTKLNLSFFHKNDDKFDYFTILDQNFNDFFNTYFFEKNIPDWFYSSPFTFLNSFIHGFFQTNGTVVFNKENTKSFITFKITGVEFSNQLIDLVTNKYGFLTTFSLIPNKPFCKVSIKLTKELFGLLETGFSYKNIHNENKRELLAKSTGIYFQNPANIPYRYKKIKNNTGYNLFIPGCKGFTIGNGLFISSIHNSLTPFRPNKNKY